MRQTVVAPCQLQNTAAAGIGAVALPAVFLLQRSMASSNVFIGGAFYFFPSLVFIWLHFLMQIASVAFSVALVFLVFGKLRNEI